MTTVTQKNDTYIIHLQKNTNIDMSKVYNQSFFSIFPLKGLRVFKDTMYSESKIKDENEMKPKPREIVENNPENSDVQDDIINILGKETAPNSYTELPLQTTESSGDISNTHDTSDNDDGTFYSNLSGYLTKYIPSAFLRNDDPSNMGMKLTIPLDIKYPVYTFKDYIMHVRNNDFLNVENSSLEYDNIYVILRDLFIQIEYLKNIGYMFDKLEINKLTKVQERFLYLDSENIVIYNKKDEHKKELNMTFLNLVRDLLHLNSEGEVCEQLKNIQYTQLYYFIKRIEREGVMIWI